MTDDQVTEIACSSEQPNSLLGSTCQFVIAKIEALLLRLSQRPRWLLTGTLAALALSLFMTFPHVSFFTGKDKTIQSFWGEIQEQSLHPFSKKIYAAPENHAAKLAFRLTPPIAMRVLNLSPNGLIVAQMILGVMLLYAVGGITNALYRDRITTLATVFGVSSTFAGKAAFLELGGIGDGIAFSFLTFAAYFRAAPIIFISVLIACFTDERAAVAGPLLAVYWMIRGAKNGAVPVWLSLRPMTVIASLLCYLALRWYLGHNFGMHTPIGVGSGVGTEMLWPNLGRMQWELPRSLAGLWIFVIVGAFLLWRSRQRTIVIILVIGCCAVIGAAWAVDDVQRSLGYLLPSVFVGIAAMAHQGLTLKNAREISIVAFIISLLLPINSYFSVHTYGVAESNLFPIELGRLIYYLGK